jgi:2-oxoisovalerate dehydrogenase E1 component
VAENAPWPDAREAGLHVYASPATEPRSAEPRDAAGAGREISFTAATLEVLDQEMGLNPCIFVLGEGIGARGGNFGTTAALFAKYGAERLRDTPICERGFVGLACGAAMTGSRPIVDFMFADFLNDAFGELINQIAKMQYMSSGRLKMPVLLRGAIGIGHSAATHHSGSYHAIYSHIPGLRVVVPATPYDAKGLFARALRSDDPVLFLEPRELLSVKGPVPAGFYEIEFGRARIRREGTDVTAVAIGQMVPRTLAAANELAAQGISVEVLDPRTVSPLDTAAILTSVRKTGRLLVVDESFGPCGLASEIAAQVAGAGFDDLDAPIRRLHGAFAPTPYSPALEAAMIPNAGAIAAAIQELVNE